MTEALGLRATPSVLAALSAMASERIALDRKSVLALLRIMARHGDDPAAARAAARALAAGLDAESPALESILSYLADNDASVAVARADTPDRQPPNSSTERNAPDERGGSDDAAGNDPSDGGGSSTGGDGQGPGGRNGRGRDDDAGERGRGIGSSLEGPSLEQGGMSLAGTLKAMACKAIGDEAYRGLQRPATDGSGWVCVPFSLTIEGMALHGFFRICYDSTRRVERFVADIRSGGRRRLLDLSGTGSALEMRYGADDEAEMAGFKALFSRDARVACQPVADAYVEEIVRRRSVDEDA